MTEALLPMPPYAWQEQVWRDFCAKRADQRLPHAFMLSGAEGIGMEELALAMGQYLMCLSPINNIACGKCRGCQLVNAGTHPDLHVIEPEEKSKSIKIDQIRAITGVVDQTASQSGYKVVVLWPVEAMNVNAANALLKNLEEPSGKTVFLLVSRSPNRVLPTVRSRCLKVPLALPDAEAAIAWLASVGVEEDDAEELLCEANGAPLVAKHWHDTGLMKERVLLVEDLAKVANHTIEPMAFAKKWQNSEPSQVLMPMIAGLEAALSNVMAERSFARHYSALLEVLTRCQPEFLFRLHDSLMSKKAQMLASPNLNSTLFIEELSLDWAVIAKFRSI